MTGYLLKECVWEITLKCCYNCKYCGSSGGRERDNELSTEECLSIVEQLSDMGCRRVSLIGGEVFLRHDWKEIVGALIKEGIITSIVTNGFLISDVIIKQLRKLNLESVAISLDGPSEVNDKYRQVGSYKAAIVAIKQLTNNQIPVSIITTINSENVHFLEEMYKVLCRYPIKAWQLQACSPMGNVRSSNMNYKFNPNEVMKFVSTKQKDASFIIGVADNIGYYDDNEYFIRGDDSGSISFHGCKAGLSAIGIDSVGNVRGCESMYDECFIEGNLREKTLKEIWESPTAFSYNRWFARDLLTGKCVTCDLNMKCAGGCRSYNYFAHGKLYESAICLRMQDCH